VPLQSVLKTARQRWAVPDAAQRTGEHQIEVLPFVASGPDKREWVAETAWKLLEARQSVTGPLLVTTNRTTAEIEATYGEAVASRLAALCAVLDVRGDDERRRVA
jgi:hypothetical protein